MPHSAPRPTNFWSGHGLVLGGAKCFFSLLNLFVSPTFLPSCTPRSSSHSRCVRIDGALRRQSCALVCLPSLMNPCLMYHFFGFLLILRDFEPTIIMMQSRIIWTSNSRKTHLRWNMPGWSDMWWLAVESLVWCRGRDDCVSMCRCHCRSRPRHRPVVWTSLPPYLLSDHLRLNTEHWHFVEAWDTTRPCRPDVALVSPTFPSSSRIVRVRFFPCPHPNVNRW